MTKRLFSTAKKRRPYRPRGYRSVFATDVDPETEEETTSEVSEEEVGLSADEFTGDLTDDPLADLADESIWAVTPGTDEDYSVTEDDFEREEAITNTSSRRVANDEVLESLNPTGTIFTEYNPQGRASLELAPNIVPYSETSGMSPDDRVVVYRGVPKGVQSELADGDFITDMEQLAKDYAGTGDVISQEVFADEILDDLDDPLAGEYLFRPRRASKKTANEPYSVYHGTSSSAAEKIRNEGLKPPTGMGARWFMLTDSYDQAARYAPADQDPVVMEFSVSDSDIYSRGNKDSVLWQATPHSAYGFDANAYAVRGDSLPSSYLKGVHPVAGEKTSSRREADRFQDDKYQPGTLYRGLSVDLLSDDDDDFYYSSKKTAQDYFMEHRPGGPDFGSPLHDLNDTFPDIYDSPHYYDFGEPGNKDSFSVIQRAKGNPEEMVTMYRSIPPDGTPSFAPGDWVSTSGDYARSHSLSENEEDDDFIVMEQQVPASSLWSEGNSVAEWGYHGDALDGTISEKYTPKKTLERLRSQKTSSRRTAGPVISEPMTLYRGEGSHDRPSYYPPGSGMAGGWWTSDLDSARSYAQGQNGDVYEIDVEPGEAEQRGLPKYFFIEDQKVRERRRPFVSRTANSDFPALPEDFVRNISPDGFDSRWTYETTGYEPRSSDDRYDLSINPVNSPAVIPGEENGLRKKPIFYDPERTELEWDELFGHSPTRQDRDLSHLAPPEGLLWRGMSNEEYENAKRDGYFQSKGDWNFEGQEGETYFSTDPNAAANYANDFAPIQFKPGFGNPAHVIGIPDRPELPRYEHEVGVPGQIPFSDVVQHYTGHPTAISPGSSSYFNDISTGEWSEGGGSGPSVSLAWERGEGYEPKTSRRVAGTEDRPGNIYRGIASDFLTDDEYDQIVDWARQNEFDPDNFQLAEPNYEMIYPILERLEGEGGLGRHWSIDYDVAEDFASHGAWHYDEENDRDEDDPDYRSPFGIVFRGDWDGEGVDYAEQHRGYDGVMRPSNLEHEKEVTLHPGSEVNLLGMDVFEPGGFRYDIPVPDIKVRAHRRTPERKKNPMTAIDRYLRYAAQRGMDPQSKSTLRAFGRSDRGTSKTAQRDISRWFVAQKVAHDTARDVLASSRNYRRKMSSSWHLDNKLSAYVSKVQQKFACSCGAKLDVPAYNICKCGKIWNAYKVHSATKGDTMYVVREVPVRENVLVAGRGKTASRRRQAQGGSWKANDNSRPYGGFDNPATYELIETLANDPYAIEQAQYAESADDLWDIGLEVMPQGFDFSSVNWKQVDEDLNADFYGDYHDGPARNIDKRVSRRRHAYDVEDDTYDFFEKARERGYRFPKNMGDDPDSGTFQDELYNYTGGDRDRMRQVTDFARDNWGQHRNFDPYYYR